MRSEELGIMGCLIGFFGVIKLLKTKNKHIVKHIVGADI